MGVVDVDTDAGVTGLQPLSLASSITELLGAE